MARPLSARERAVLEHVVEDADAWWAHVQTVYPEPRAEAALAKKVARWEGSYDAAVAAEGAGYKRRTDRSEVAPAELPAAQRGRLQW